MQSWTTDPIARVRDRAYNPKVLQIRMRGSIPGSSIDMLFALLSSCLAALNLFALLNGSRKGRTPWFNCLPSFKPSYIKPPCA